MLPYATPARPAADAPPSAYLHEVEDFYRNHLLWHILNEHEAFGAEPLPTAADDASPRPWRDNFKNADRAAVREFQYSNIEDDTVYHCRIVPWEQLTIRQRHDLKEICNFEHGGDTLQIDADLFYEFIVPCCDYHPVGKM